jgi:hypothetical protein
VGVSPISGLTSGGQSVTITGSNLTGATGVLFGGVAASSFTIDSSTQITATTPPDAAGTIDVTVTTPGGSSTTTTADRFQYVARNGTAPPTVARAASATLASNQVSATLSVLGASQYAASTLTYTWSTTGTPPATVTFSANGNNSASVVRAIFSKVGAYNFLVTITDPAGNSVTSDVGVTVNQVATTLTVSPNSGAVVPGGTLQFSDTASDQFGNPYTATPVSWTVNGGGTIGNTGDFTAGSATGGPFTVTASAGGLVARAQVTIFLNLAPSGTAYRWYAMSSATANANQTAAPGLNDNNSTTGVVLTGGGDDVANAYEAAGVIWTTSQSLSEVTFTNGSFNSSTYDGVFDNNFGLQTTTDGTTWTSVSGWSLSPAYQYNVPAAAGVTYTFTGPAVSVLGIRVVGQVHSLSGNDSWYDIATEVQAFGLRSGGSTGSVNAAFLGTDTTDQGNWRNAYGADGYDIAADTSGTDPKLPSYATVALTGAASTWTWTTSTADPRALQDAAGTGRIASAWYSTAPFGFDINLTDGLAHEVSLYALDWDKLGGGRDERIDVLSAATGKVLDSRTISGFSGGEYLSWTLQGHVILKVTNLNPKSNAVLSGLFFGA